MWWVVDVVNIQPIETLFVRLFKDCLTRDALRVNEYMIV